MQYTGLSLRPYSGSDDRLFRHYFCLEITKHNKEPIAECGIGTGFSMFYLNSYLAKKKDGRHYYGFDTFEGFPYIHEQDLEGIPEQRKKISRVGNYAWKSYFIERQARFTGNFSGIHFYKGRFEESMPKLSAEQKFSFVFMDCDLYQSYKTCLEHMYHRVVSGGVILFDEYHQVRDWPGAKKAIDEFFADKPEKPERLPFGDSWIVRKQ